MRAALEAGELTLYAQPAIDLETGEVAHREVLPDARALGRRRARLRLPGRRRPGAEPCAEIDRWVVEQALAWLADGYQGSHLHVNLSGETVNDGRSLTGFVETLRGRPSAVPAWGWRSARRRSGATTSPRPRQSASARRRLLACPGRFTGRAGSFEYLQRLPLDQVKIDGAVTRG